MKKSTHLTIAFTLICSVGFSQNKIGEPNKTYKNKEGQKIEVYKASSFKISKPLLELSEDVKNRPVNKAGKKKIIPNNFKHNKIVNENSLPTGNDPVWQKDQGNKTSKAPIANFDGLPVGFGIPLDPSGAASASHYVQAINTKYRVYDKTGNGVSVPLNLSSLWSGSTDDGDPIVLYDKHADRWFISQFQSSPPYKLLVAVSQTNNPTGSYYAYSFTVTDLPDYPKYSIWSDGYYFSINSGQGTSGVMDRTKMLAGDQTATLQIVTAPSHATNGFTSLLPADADGSLPPNGSPCYFFNLRDDAWGQGSDAILIYKMTTDFNTPSNTSIISDGTITPSAFDTDFQTGTPANSFQHISQKGTTDKLDAIAEVLYYRAQHRIWTGYNSVVLCHVVDVDGNNTAGMRWYELRQSNGTWALYQEGTYAPADTDNRWMGSISMDDQGNIGLAYSASGPNTYPSIRYTGRKPTDPLGQMTFTEETAFTGLGSQTTATGGDRYGDYSHLSLDPDGETFWHTAEYVAADGFPRTRIYSFKLAAATGISDNPYYQNLETKILNRAGSITFNVKGLKDNEYLTFDVFDVAGKLISHKDVHPNNNQFKETINTTNLSKGIYMVRFGNPKFQIVEKVSLSK